MAKKKVVASGCVEQEEAIHPLLLKLRNHLQELSNYAKNKDEVRVGLAAIQFLGVIGELAMEFGADLERMTIPDSFFDAFDQHARLLALIGMSTACCEMVK